MSPALVMLVALSGLGCGNKPAETSGPLEVLVPADASQAQAAAPATTSPAADAPGAIPSPPQAATPGTMSPAADAPGASPSLPPVTTSVSPSPPPYPRYYPETDPDVEDLYSTHAGILFATFYSFVWGKDPGIPSAAKSRSRRVGHSVDH